MAEIRCPMCAKPNPEELDVCQFCEARLRPLIIQPSQTEREDELPYWLKANQEDKPDNEDIQPEEEAEGAEDSQDWLARFRSDSEIEEEQPLDQEPESAADEDESDGGEGDWMQRFRSLRDADNGFESEASATEPDDESLSEFASEPTMENGNIAPEEPELSDWLDRFRQDQGVEDTSEPDQDALPDWIPSEPSDEIGEEPQLPAEDEETPDWLAELGIEGETRAPKAAEPALESEHPDWIPSESSDEIGEEPQLPAEDEETPDWLAELGIEGETPAPEAAEPALESELPDWIPSEPSDEIEEEPQLPAEDEETPDWLAELGIEGETPAPKAAEPVLEGELPDWITSESRDEIEAEPELQAEDEETPDWLAALGIEGETPAPEAAEPALESELPDWTTGEPSDEIEAKPELQAEAEETPDWLAELSIAYDKATQEEAEPSMEGELPDWLSGAHLDETEPQDQEEEIPDWVSEPDARSRFPSAEGDIESEWFYEPEQEGPEEVEAPQRPGDQLPDWIYEPAEAIEPSSQETPDMFSVQDQEPVSGEDEDLQGWFSELEKDAVLSDESAPEGAVPVADEDMPGWLKNLGSVVTGTVEDEEIPLVTDGGISPFVGQDDLEEDFLDAESLPEWLSPQASTPEEPEPKGESDLTPAELPGWLAAMRPVDVKKPKTPVDEGGVESAGPLAGLHSVLPAEPEITHFKKPPVYSAKLQVTSSQKAHADLFHKMLSAGEGIEPVPTSPLITTQHAFRWLVAFIFIISIGIFIIGGGEFFPPPGNTGIPDSTYAASKIINTIPDQAPVLLAFDYEPGIAGEMNAAAASLVDHLMLKGARLTLVSTLPAGPAMAEYFIQTIQKQHDYTSGMQYINLGYLPGGATGLLSFAQTPEWVFPLSYNGVPPWETAPLQDVEKLSDFALVVVITENPEDARAWIEQVQPRLEDTPLLTVLSAQAEPMVRPYFSSEPNAQVNGIVSGLFGGAAYEVAVGRTNLGRTYWDAFSVGLIIALGAILIGGIVSGIQMLLPRDKNNSRGERS